MWRASFPIRTRPRDDGSYADSYADSDVTIVNSPQVRPRYISSHAPPSVSYRRYPAYRGPREWEEWDDEYDAPVMIRRAAPRRTSRSSGNGDEVQGRRLQEVESKAGFQKSCETLKKLLNKAIDNFETLTRGFEEDVKLIKSYAGKPIIEQLWRRKIGVPQDADDIDELDDVDPGKQSYYTNSYDLERKVVICLHRVVEASITGKRDDIKRQADSGLQTKIEASMVCIREIWPKVQQSKEHCERLLIELSQLKVILRGDNPNETNATVQPQQNYSNFGNQDLAYQQDQEGWAQGS